MAYNLLWNDDELVIEFYQLNSEQQQVKVFEERMDRDMAQKFAQRINRVANLKLSKRDNLMKQQPMPPSNPDEQLNNNIENLGI